MAMKGIAAEQGALAAIEEVIGFLHEYHWPIEIKARRRTGSVKEAR